jgi:hypothetical protein
MPRAAPVTKTVFAAEIERLTSHERGKATGLGFGIEVPRGTRVVFPACPGSSRKAEAAGPFRKELD